MINIDFVKNVDSELYKYIMQEKKRQSSCIELIASENYQSDAVLAVQASVLANKYSEGFPNRRYYGGQQNIDLIESIAINRAKNIFRCDHANVQALSGASANICAYNAFMQPGDSILGMDLSHGGHLTHGASVTMVSKIYNFVRYKTQKDGKIDYYQLRKIAIENKPKVILAGFSAYPRELDYTKFAEIAKEVGAISYADISHIGGFIACNELRNPFDYGFHAVMTTTHKSLRGPRGALLLSKGIVSNPLKTIESNIENIPTMIDRSVFPGVQGGPHMNTIGAIAIALKESQSEEFLNYAKQTLINAKIMAEEFIKLGYDLITGGTDNHMIVIDLTNKKIDGDKAQKVLDLVGISTSKSTIPDDPNPPFRPSGLRIGIQAMTTRGISQIQTQQIVNFVDKTLKNIDKEDVLSNIKNDVIYFCENL